MHAQSTHTVVCLLAWRKNMYNRSIRRTHCPAARTAPTNGDERMGGKEEICTTNVSDSYRAHTTHTHTDTHTQTNERMCIPLPSPPLHPTPPACVHQVRSTLAARTHRQTDCLAVESTSSGCCVGAGRCVATVKSGATSQASVEVTVGCVGTRVSPSLLAWLDPPTPGMKVWW